MLLPFRCGCVFFIPLLRYIMYVIAFLYSFSSGVQIPNTPAAAPASLSTPLPAFLNSSLSSLSTKKPPLLCHLHLPAVSVERAYMWRRECVCSGWKKGEEGGVVFCTLVGLWRNLPVRLEQGEEEPVGCGTPDKGDIYTLTLDHWSERRGRQLENFTFLHRRQSSTPGLLLVIFLCVCLWKTLSERDLLWIHS